MKKQRKKHKICSNCIYLQKAEDDWVCGCGRGFVEPYTPACKEYEA